MALSNWKEMRKQLKIDEDRRIARFQLEQIKAMCDFHNLTRSPMGYPTCTRTQCFDYLPSSSALIKTNVCQSSSTQTLCNIIEWGLCSTIKSYFW
ncbi:hypothetical protein P8452_37369 [Trifolium repens]|nr:hypothetical protein P8452_37369 [Trifolium repens]